MKNVIYILPIVLLLSSCGSKNKVLEITKTETMEKKDLSMFENKKELSIVTFTRDASEMTVEPNNPDIPLIIGKDTIHNAKKVTYRKEKVDSMATTDKSSEIGLSDKGESNISTKEKHQEKEKTVQILWWQILIIVIVVVGLGFYGWLKAKGKRLF